MSHIFYNPADVAAFLCFLDHTAVGGVTEVRALPKERYLTLDNQRVYVGNAISGYFDADHYDKAAHDIANLDGMAHTYVTLNPCKPELLARAHNRLQRDAKTTTGDHDVQCLMWLPIDCDPARPAGISSSNGELAAAIAQRDEVAAWLAERGAVMVKGMSGNGGHGLVRLPAYPNDEEHRSLVKQVIEGLARMFSDDKVSVDAKVFNPARIWKVYGTLAIKGDNVPDRPHRRATIELPDVPPAPFDIRELLPHLPQPEEAQQRATYSGDGTGTRLDAERYVKHYAGDFKRKVDGGRTIYAFDCPFNPDHRHDANLTQFANGAVAFSCFHNSCRDKDWHALKQLWNPREFWESGTVGRRENVSQDNSTSSEQTPKPESDEQKQSFRPLRRYTPSAIMALEFPAKSRSLSLRGAQGYIEEGGSHLLGAKPKTGKTELLIRAACDWQDKRVTFISEESERVWKKRLSRFPTLPDHIEIICALGESPATILHEVETTSSDVVIIDTIRNLLGIPNELDNGIIALRLTPYVAAAQRRRLTLIAVQHLRKRDDGDITDLFSGGNAYSGIVDMLLALQRKQGDEKRLELRRRGRGAEDATDLFEWRDGDLLWLGDAAGMERRQLRERALKAVRVTDEWLKTREVLDLVGEPKPSVDTLLEVLNGLFADGLIQRDPAKSKPRATYKWRNLSAAPKETFSADSLETPPDSRENLSAENLPYRAADSFEPNEVEQEAIEV
jgi:hypothetical protein